MLFILLCIKLGFPKFFKFYEFLKNRFQPFRHYPKRKRCPCYYAPRQRQNLVYLFLLLSSTSSSTMRFYNRTEELEYYRNGMRGYPPTDLEWWTSLFIVCSFFSVIIVCVMYPKGTWFQCVSGATLLYLFWQVVVNYVDCP
ncbi:hypothetical protein V8C34DRAFT_320994 [Trichoderma compactum]